MRKFKVIIVDDERSARQELKRSLKNLEDFELVGEAWNADVARDLIGSNYPDLIFLDIQMPEESGFALMESLNEVPDVIFVTAFDQYAVRAFEISALDYLLKPVREERFTIAIEKFRARVAERGSGQAPVSESHIFVKDGQKCYLIPISSIRLIESMDNYAMIHFGLEKVLMKSSLNKLEERLDTNTFFRINRTQILNINFIQEINTIEGNLKITLNTGELLEVSDRRSVKFKARNGI